MKSLLLVAVLFSFTPAVAEEIPASHPSENPCPRQNLNAFFTVRRAQDEVGNEIYLRNSSESQDSGSEQGVDQPDALPSKHTHHLIKYLDHLKEQEKVILDNLGTPGCQIDSPLTSEPQGSDPGLGQDPVQHPNN